MATTENRAGCWYHVQRLRPCPRQPFRSRIHTSLHRAFEAWLRKNHASSDGIWLLISKAGADKPSVTYAEAVEVAICYGWIDGQKKAWDAHHWLQRFTPRRPRSIWSKTNRAKAQSKIATDRPDRKVSVALRACSSMAAQRIIGHADTVLLATDRLWHRDRSRIVHHTMVSPVLWSRTRTYLERPPVRWLRAVRQFAANPEQPRPKCTRCTSPFDDQSISVPWLQGAMSNGLTIAFRAGDIVERKQERSRIHSTTRNVTRCLHVQRRSAAIAAMVAPIAPKSGTSHCSRVHDRFAHQNRVAVEGGLSKKRWLVDWCGTDPGQQPIHLADAQFMWLTLETGPGAARP